MTQQIDLDGDGTPDATGQTCPVCGEPYECRVSIPLPSDLTLDNGVSVCTRRGKAGFVHKDKP